MKVLMLILHIKLAYDKDTIREEEEGGEEESRQEGKKKVVRREIYLVIARDHVTAELTAIARNGVLLGHVPCDHSRWLGALALALHGRKIAAGLRFAARLQRRISHSRH